MNPRIAVVGAGCAGSVAAWRMALAGLAPILFDRDAVPGASAACGGVMPGAVADRLELPPALLHGQIDTVRIVSRGRAVLRRWARPPLVSVERCACDRFLAERAAASGAELRSGCRVVTWRPDDGRLSWQEGHADLSERFDLVVFADGPASVARRSGLGLGPATPLGAAFFRELEGEDPPLNEIGFYLDRQPDDPGYLWVFAKRGHVQVGIGRFSSGHAEPLRRALDRFIAADPDLAGLRRRRTRGGLVPLATARRLVMGSGLVIGDAAGLVNPITGGGLAYAVASGELAAQAAVEGAGRGRDGAWVARRYRQLLERSVHLWWLRALGLLLAPIRRQAGAGRSSGSSAPFRVLAARLLPLASLLGPGPRYRSPGC